MRTLTVVSCAIKMKIRDRLFGVLYRNLFQEVNVLEPVSIWKVIFGFDIGNTLRSKGSGISRSRTEREELSRRMLKPADASVRPTGSRPGLGISLCP